MEKKKLIESMVNSVLLFLEKQIMLKFDKKVGKLGNNKKRWNRQGIKAILSMLCMKGSSRSRLEYINYDL